MAFKVESGALPVVPANSSQESKAEDAKTTLAAGAACRVDGRDLFQAKPDALTLAAGATDPADEYWNGVQDRLDYAGMAPGPTGMIADAANAGISVGRQRWTHAAMSAGAFLPVVGTVFEVGKVLPKVARFAGHVPLPTKPTGKLVGMAIHGEGGLREVFTTAKGGRAAFTGQAAISGGARVGDKIVDTKLTVERLDVLAGYERNSASGSRVFEDSVETLRPMAEKLRDQGVRYVHAQRYGSTGASGTPNLELDKVIDLKQLLGR